MARSETAQLIEELQKYVLNNAVFPSDYCGSGRVVPLSLLRGWIQRAKQAPSPEPLLALVGAHPQELHDGTGVWLRLQSLLTDVDRYVLDEDRCGSDEEQLAELAEGLVPRWADRLRAVLRDGFRANREGAALVGAETPPQEPKDDEQRRIEGSLAVELLHELGDLETWHVDDPLSPFVGELVVSLEAVQALLAAVEDLPVGAPPPQETEEK